MIADILVLPNAISLLPVPVTPSPITTWSVPPTALISEFAPITVLKFPEVIASPADFPITVLELPVVTAFKASKPIPTLLLLLFPSTPVPALYPSHTL